LSGDSGTVAGKYPAGNMVVQGTRPTPGVSLDPGEKREGVVDPYGNNVPSRINEAERQDYRNNDVVPVPRRIAAVQIGNATLTMHLDLGAAVSQLPESVWSEAHLAPADAKLRLVDEAASVRYVTRVGVAAEVAVGSAKAHQVTFAPFVDKRFPGRTVEGALGLDFFRGYAVYASWHDKTYYLKARGDAAATATARLGRWGAALPACPHPGCVAAQIVAAAGGPMLEVVRDPETQGRGLEVLLAPLIAGKSPAPLIVELPRGVDKVENALPPDYAGAQIQVADVSPFPRVCAGEGGCVVPLDGSLTRGMPEAPVAAVP
ncbi:MAG: retropepsin-like aspartic protease, partial [bacterium]